MKRPLIAGNWKMHKTVVESVEFCKELGERLRSSTGRVDILVCPSFTSLYAVSRILAQHGIYLGAQNMHYEDSGAFTGEISPVMLKDIGCSFVIIGHSERRHIFGEDNDLISRKVRSAVRHGIVPILCVGELLEEAESGKTFSVIGEQLRKGLGMILDEGGEFVIAYEPVWAIGTGKTATVEIIRKVHSFIRDVLVDMFGKRGSGIRILYGGSVKPSNIGELMSVENVDGVLVGGASLDVDSFLKIVNYSEE